MCLFCVCVCVHVGGWVHVLNTLVFNEMLECRCSLMLLVTHSAMQLRSLSAWSFLHTTVHPSTLTVGGSDGVENGGKMEKRNPNVGNSEMSWITSVLMNSCLLNSYKPYTVHVHWFQVLVISDVLLLSRYGEKLWHWLVPHTHWL